MFFKSNFFNIIAKNYDFCSFFFLSDCPRGYFSYQGMCVLQCPSGHYGSAIGHYRSASDQLTASSCLPCHYSCLDCHGPNDYQCVACHGDALLTDGYCEPRQLADELRGLVAWNDIVVGVFTALGIVTVALTIYVVVSLWPPPCCRDRKEYVSVDRSFSKSSDKSINSNVVPYYDSDDEQ